MITPRRIAAAFFGTAAGLFLGRALFKWILDLHGAWEWGPIVALAVAGCVLGVVSELEKEEEQRSAARLDRAAPDEPA